MLRIVWRVSDIKHIFGEPMRHKKLRQLEKENNMTKNKAMLQALKTEAANAVNVNLKQGYNGDITAREAGSIGGEMVKRMIAYAEQNMNGGNMMK